jgi:tetratricopeptide (TPR) repeat protein
MLMMRVHGLGNRDNLPAMSQELETSISLDPTFADSYALLAFAQSTSGDNSKAISSLEKAIVISPRDENYQLNLAGLYLSNRQPEQAAPLLQSLNNASDPRIAAQANSMLAEVQQMREMGKESAQFAADSSTDKDSPAPVLQRNTVSANSVKVAAAPVRPAPAKFLQGTLANIDCSTGSSALLTVVSGAKTWKMTVGDRKHLVLIGADEFSCFWAKKKVALNYHETSAGEGSVISLEIQ